VQPTVAHRSSRGLKICDLTQFYSPVSGGVRRYIEQKSAFLRAHRPDCEHVIIVPGESTARSGDDKVRVYTIAAPLVSRTSRYRALTKLHLIEEALEKERPDIIESGDPYQVAWKAVASGRGLDIPVVGFYHSHFPEAYIRTVAKFFGRVAISITDDICKSYVKALYNRFECTFVPSPVLARLLGTWGVERLHTVDLGVDAAIFLPGIPDRTETRERIGVPEAARLLLYVGRLAQEKNVRTLFRAFSILHARSPGKYHLLCVGDGVQRPAVVHLREKPEASTGCPTARTRTNWPRSTVRRISSSIPACRKPSGWWLSRARLAARASSVSAAATWTGSFSATSICGRQKIPLPLSPMPSNQNSLSISGRRASRPAPRPAAAIPGPTSSRGFLTSIPKWWTASADREQA